MAKLFANKFNLDNLPEPVKPVPQPIQVPNNVVGVGTTIVFPQTISLKDRLQQPKLGTTRHLPEFIVSDLNTGFIDIKKQSISQKTSQVQIQKVNYEKTILNQGGIETLLRGIVSLINPFKFGEKEIEQGSITIKNLQTAIKKTSPVTIQKVTGEKITNPNTKINKVIPGERTTNPNIEVKQVEPGERTVNPNIKVNEVIPGDRTTNPDIRIEPVKPGSRTTDPKTVITPVVPGERTVDPQIDITPVQPGDRTFNPNIDIPLVVPGERTFDPKTVVTPVEPGDRTTIVDNRLYLFEQTDNKIQFAQRPEIFVNIFDIFPSDSITPLTSDISYNEYNIDTKYVEALNSLQIQTTGLQTSILPDDIVGVGAYVGNAGSIGDGKSYTEIPKPIKSDGGLSKYNNKAKYIQAIGNDSVTLTAPSPLKTAGSEEIPTYVEEVPIEGGFSDVTKPATFPPAQYADPALPGGYRTLNYVEIQRRRSDNPNKNLDFSYEERNGVEPAYVALGMPTLGADTLNGSVDSEAKDFAVVKIESPRDGITLQFRSFIKNFSDTFTPNYTDVNYVGRPDTLKVFKGTTRQIGLAFVVVAFSKDDLKVIYQKLEKLIKIGTMGKRDGIYLQGPFIKLHVGGWCQNTPAILTSLKYDTNPTEYTWDIDEQVPQLVDVSIDCTVLGSNTGGSFLESGTFIQYGA